MTPELIRDAFTRQLGTRWNVALNDADLVVEHQRFDTTYHPPRRRLPWPELLDRLDDAFGAVGVPKERPLPLRWGHETELTISAVQAADPFLKWGQAVPFRSGYIPQPVVRTTAARDANGHLMDGYVTSFVNTSRVQPVSTPGDIGLVFDQWLTVLSRLGLHARHIRLHGNLTLWRRREVQGITLRYSHAAMELGDLVILQSVDQPDRYVVDLGSGLERIAWVRSRLPWPSLIHGTQLTPDAADQLDVLRTAILLIGSGITPSPRGAGSITHRFLARLRNARTDVGTPAIASVARSIYRYWDLTSPMHVPWNAVHDFLVRAVTQKSI